MSKHSHHSESAAPVGEAAEVTEKTPESAAPAGANGGAGEGAANAAPAGEGGGGEDLATRIAALETQLAIATAQAAELNDQYLRKAADFENFRKRMNREKQEAIDFANQALLLDLITVIDDFDRAIKSAETSRDFASFYEGISMIEKRLSAQLENKWALKRFDSEGEAFDPNRHEAIQMEKAPGITEAVVAEDFIKGYCLKDRVIRCAKVKVLMPGGGEAPPPGEAASEGAPPPGAS